MRSRVVRRSRKNPCFQGQGFTPGTSSGYEPAAMTRRLAPLLAVLMLLQWAAAYGHCRALQAAAHSSVPGLPGWQICSVHDGSAPAPDGPALHADWDCPACHHVPFLDAAPPPVINGTAVAWVLAAIPRTHGAVATLGPRAPPPPARAPPILA